MSQRAPAGRPSLLTNTVAQSAPLIIGYAAGLLTAPLVLSSIGLRAFGIWALTGALAQYGGLLGLGIEPAISRFVALHDATGDQRAVGETMAVGLLSVPAVALPLAIAAWFGAAPLAHTLHGIGVATMRGVLLASVVMLCAAMASAVLTAYPIGLRKMVRPNVALSAGALLNLAFSITALLASHRLLVYALANAAASALTLLIVLVALANAAPRIPLARPTLARAREILAYSTRTQVVVLSNLVNFQTDKIVIALFIGPTAAGAYELCNRVALAFRGAATYATSALIPTLTVDMASLTRAAIADGYERLTQRISAVSIPFLLLAAALAPILLRAWLGVHLHNGTLFLAALSLSYVINVTTTVGYSYLVAAGEPGIPARASLTAAVANVAFTIALGELWGIWGILAGTAIALTGGALYQVSLTHRHFAIPEAAYWRAILPALATATALGIPLLALSEASRSLPRGAQAAIAVGGAIAYLAAYFVAAGYLDILPRSLSTRLPLVRAHLAGRAP